MAKDNKLVLQTSLKPQKFNSSIYSWRSSSVYFNLISHKPRWFLSMSPVQYNGSCMVRVVILCSEGWDRRSNGALKRRACGEGIQTSVTGVKILSVIIICVIGYASVTPVLAYSSVLLLMRHSPHLFLCNIWLYTCYMLTQLYNIRLWTISCQYFDAEVYALLLCDRVDLIIGMYIFITSSRHSSFNSRSAAATTVYAMIDNFAFDSNAKLIHIHTYTGVHRRTPLKPYYLGLANV